MDCYTAKITYYRTGVDHTENFEGAQRALVRGVGAHVANILPHEEIVHRGFGSISTAGQSLPHLIETRAAHARKGSLSQSHAGVGCGHGDVSGGALRAAKLSARTNQNYLKTLAQ